MELFFIYLEGVDFLNKSVKMIYRLNWINK